MTERFTRASPDQLNYEFTVEDPAYYTQPWRAEMSFNARKENMYEYACHEGNYAMEGILRGARNQEAQGIKPSQGPGIFGTPIPEKKNKGGSVIADAASLACRAPLACLALLIGACGEKHTPEELLPAS